MKINAISSNYSNKTFKKSNNASAECSPVSTKNDKTSFKGMYRPHDSYESMFMKAAIITAIAVVVGLFIDTSNTIKSLFSDKELDLGDDNSNFDSDSYGIGYKD